MNTRAKAHQLVLSNLRMVIVALFCLVGCREPILSDLTQEQVSQLQVVLARNGVSATKARGASGWTLSVDSADATSALSIVENSFILRRVKHSESKSTPSFIRSREERLYDLERSLAVALEDTLLRVPGVVEARVHLFFEMTGTLAGLRESRPKRASVLLIVDNRLQLQKAQIATLVSAAVAIDDNLVTVVVTQAVAGGDLTPSPVESAKSYQEEDQTMVFGSLRTAQPEQASESSQEVNTSTELRLPGYLRGALGKLLSNLRVGSSGFAKLAFQVVTLVVVLVVVSLRLRRYARTRTKAQLGLRPPTAASVGN